MSEATGRPQFQPVLRTLLGDGLTVRFRASGCSMLPTICDGDTLVVEPVDPASIRRDDVIVVETPGSVRAHRVVSEGDRPNGAFILRGDALQVPDAPISPEQILGRVAEVKRDGRRRTVCGPLVRARAFLRRSLVAVRDFLRMHGDGLKGLVAETGSVSPPKNTTIACIRKLPGQSRES